LSHASSPEIQYLKFTLDHHRDSGRERELRCLSLSLLGHVPEVHLMIDFLETPNEFSHGNYAKN
jgi:hypothetical protein